MGIGEGTGTGEMNYSDMSQEEVDALIRQKVPKRSFVYGIGCRGMSVKTLGEMCMGGEIGDYIGYNIDNDSVNETRKQGLTARLVTKEFNHKIGFESLKRSGGEKAVVAMFELSEKEPEVARRYAKQARDLGITVVSYPEI